MLWHCVCYAYVSDRTVQYAHKWPETRPQMSVIWIQLNFRSQTQYTPVLYIAIR